MSTDPPMIVQDSPLNTKAEEVVLLLNDVLASIDAVLDVKGVGERCFTDMTAEEIRGLKAMVAIAAKSVYSALDVSARASNRAAMNQLKVT